MNVPRFWPAVQVLGRTIACNRSDKFQQGARFCNQSANSHIIQNSSSSNSFPNSNFEDRLRIQQNLLHTGRGSYLKVVSKSFSTGVQLFCREFTDGENEHAHDILCSLPAYKNTTINTKLNSVNYVNTFSTLTYQDKFWPAVGTDELVNTFLSISEVLFMYNNITTINEQFNNLFNSLVERIPYMTDDHLLTVLSGLSYWPQDHCYNLSKFDTIWKTLDKCCSQRIKYWGIPQIFLVADHWYALRITKLTMFLNKLVCNIGPRLMNLSPTQFVQFMFYANLNRELTVKNNELQRKIAESLKFISIEELGIIAMAVFKTQTNLPNGKVVESILNFTEKNLDIISDHSLGSLLKLLGKNLPSDSHTICYKFLESLNPHLHKFNNFVLLQVAIFGNRLLVFHEDSLHKVALRFAKEMTFLRLKDIERFSYALMLYQYIPMDCPNIVSLIVQELRKSERIVEINHFPRCFSSCVNYLIAMGVFPHDLISAALQPLMVQLFKGDSLDASEKNLGREINEIDWSIKIELPSTYLGYKLSPKMSTMLTEHCMGRISPSTAKDLTHQEKLMYDIQSKLSAMIGSGGNVEPYIILPHFSHPDLVFCTTLEGEPVKLPEEFRDYSFAELKPASKFDHLGLLWNAVMIGGRNSIIKETKELKGNLLMKKRQLMKLGYKVSMIPHYGYVKSGMKCKFQVLEECLKDSSLNLEERREMGYISLKENQVLQRGNMDDVHLESIIDEKKMAESFHG